VNKVSAGTFEGRIVWLQNMRNLKKSEQLDDRVKRAKGQTATRRSGETAEQNDIFDEP
jgi:hypothetical protein